MDLGLHFERLFNQKVFLCIIIAGGGGELWHTALKYIRVLRDVLLETILMLQLQIKATVQNCQLLC